MYTFFQTHKFGYPLLESIIVGVRETLRCSSAEVKQFLISLLSGSS